VKTMISAMRRSGGLQAGMWLLRHGVSTVCPPKGGLYHAPNRVFTQPLRGLAELPVRTPAASSIRPPNETMGTDEKIGTVYFVPIISAH
jgi:hypothetical protein